MSEAPRATYRLQLHRGFRFEDAAGLADDLVALGVSHVYLSPIMAARPGSTHGYDVVDHTRINEELGGDEGFAALYQALRARGLGLIVDIVPNHMGIGSDNAWWLDVLEWGPHSPYAEFFDIDWHSSRRNLEGKVLLPVLGDQFGRVLERGEIELRLDPADGSLSAWYFEHRFPISPFDYARVLQQGAERVDADSRTRIEALARAFQALRADPGTARVRAGELKPALASAAAAVTAALAAFRGLPGVPQSWLPLGRLLDAQAYRIAYWRVSSDEINYRRFFDINTLGGLKVERTEVFWETHRTILRLVESGCIDGLRVDHIDGLFDPCGYAERLQGHAGRPGDPCYVVVEKILAPHEQLPADWPVAGTTGYEALNLIGAVTTDPDGEHALTAFYRRFTGVHAAFDDILWDSKREILENSLASELAVLADEVYRLSSSRWASRDFTLNAIRHALAAMIAAFPVYRTYVSETRPVTVPERAHIEWALGLAKRRSGPVETSVLDFVAGVLTGDLAGQDSPYPREHVLHAAMRFQQLSGPVMAKGLEDTSFYRYLRLLSHNEVGGDPRRFALSLGAFHAANRARLEQCPDSMLAATTHDTKRGEDARARLACLAEMPQQWAQRVRHWARLNRRLRRGQGRDAAPDRNHEYYLYQTLVGAWPPALRAEDVEGLAALAERVEAAIIKAVREGKQRSSWIYPDEAYEEAVRAFVHAVLDPRRSALFLADLAAFCEEIGSWGALTSLSQTLLRLTMPGVPDIYRGAELWELSMVDPDNRRPLDRQHCRALMSELDRRFASGITPGAARELLGAWHDGRIKLHLLRTVLALRRMQPQLFRRGDYQGIGARGTHAGRVIAFQRGFEAQTVVTVAPRFWSALGDGSGAWHWGDTALPLPNGCWSQVLSGTVFEVRDGALSLDALTRNFPVALLVRESA